MYIFELTDLQFLSKRYNSVTIKGTLKKLFRNKLVSFHSEFHMNREDIGNTRILEMHYIVPYRKKKEPSPV